MKRLVAVCSLCVIPQAAAEPPVKTRLPAREVTWSAVKATLGCFFFSGPEGRDDQLIGKATITRDGDAVAIEFGALVFRGVVRNGQVTAVRHSIHSFGTSWSVNEVIRGRFVEQGLLARYHYDECQRGAGDCPGHCTIDASITIR